MTERKPFPATPLIAGFAVLAVLLGGYVGCYLWLSELETVTSYELDPRAGGGLIEVTRFVRVYRLELATVFYPLARIETAVRGQSVKARYYRDNDNLLPYVQ